MKMNLSLNLSPENGGPVVASENYPEVYLRGDKELNLPEEGTITFEYKLIEERSSERNGKHTYACTLQLHKILDVEPEKDIRPSKADKSTEDALDALAKMKETEDASDNESY